jgi:hypothetical protein
LVFGCLVFLLVVVVVLVRHEKVPRGW